MFHYYNIDRGQHHCRKKKKKKTLKGTKVKMDCSLNFSEIEYQLREVALPFF